MRWMAALLSLAIFATSAGAPRASDSGKPDLVVFLADDLSWVDCSMFGGKDVPTPNMERLARDGMTFSHAFVASPSCAPSRGALLTGLDPMRNGAMLNHTRPRMELKTWPGYFHDLGYEVVSFGKTAHYGQVTTYGFDLASHYNFHQDDCIEAAVSWLEKRKSEKPLCLLVGTNWSHAPWPQKTEVDPDSTAILPMWVDTSVMRKAKARYAQAVANADRDLGMVYDAARKTMGEDTFFLFTSDHGAQFPFGKWNLYDMGVRTPLQVVWPGHVKPGSKSDAMVSWIDVLPTCLDVAGAKPPEDISGRSFLEVLSGEVDEFRDKVFLTHSGDGKMNQYPIRGVRTRRWKYIRNLDSEGEYHSHVDQGPRAVDGRDYWASWVERAKADPEAAAVVHHYHHRPAEELYDILADPWELNDLADEPGQAGTLRTLRAEVDAWMKDQGDEGMKTERALRKARPKKKKGPKT